MSASEERSYILQTHKFPKGFPMTLLYLKYYEDGKYWNFESVRRKMANNEPITDEDITWTLGCIPTTMPSIGDYFFPTDEQINELDLHD